MSKAKDEKEKVNIKDLPELQQYKFGRKVVSIMTGLGLTAVGITSTVLYALQGKPDKAIFHARGALKALVGIIDPDAKSKKKKKDAEVGLGKKLMRIFSGVAILGLGITNTVFKALRNDAIGVANDLKDIMSLSAEIAYSIMPFFGSKVKQKGRSDKFLGRIIKALNKIIDFASSIANKIAARMEQSKAGRVILRAGRAARDIITSQQFKFIFQVVNALMLVATATTPFGWAVAALSLASIAVKSIKSLLHTRSLRLLNEKKEALLALKKERNEQTLLLDKYPALKKLKDFSNMDITGERPSKPPINVAREVFSALASSFVGGAAAILEATTADATKQAATGFILLGGISQEVKGNIKKEISRLDLKDEIWELGGSNKSLSQVQSELLESKKLTTALQSMLTDINQNLSDSQIQEKFEDLKLKAAVVHPEPTFGDRVKGGFKGFAKDCDTLFFKSLRKGWNELLGRKEDAPPSLSSPKEKDSEKGVDNSALNINELKVAALVTQNTPEIEIKQGSRVQQIVAKIEEQQKNETKKEEMKTPLRSSKQNSVQKKIQVFEDMQKSFHASSVSKAAIEARNHVTANTHPQSSRSSQNAKAEKHRSV